MATATLQKKERNVVLDWSDVKHQMLRVIEGKGWGDGPNKRHHTASTWVATAAREGGAFEKNSWEGGSLSQTADWLREGFRANEFRHSAAYVPMSEKPRPAWSDEEGDPDVGRLVGGFDKFMLDRAPDEKKPGLRVMIEMAFAAGMDNDAIKHYGAWCAGLLGSLESSGYDLTVDIWVRLDGLFSDGHRDNVLIRVKRENEVSDFTEWSALFAPTGYRHTVFCAKMVAGDKIGKLCSSGLGMTLSSEWKLDYDPMDSTLKVMVNQRHYGNVDDVIPALNKQAKDLGLI